MPLKASRWAEVRGRPLSAAEIRELLAVELKIRARCRATMVLLDATDEPLPGRWLDLMAAAARRARRPAPASAALALLAQARRVEELPDDDLRLASLASAGLDAEAWSPVVVTIPDKVALADGPDAILRYLVRACSRRG